MGRVGLLYLSFSFWQHLHLPLDRLSLVDTALCEFLRIREVTDGELRETGFESSTSQQH